MMLHMPDIHRTGLESASPNQQYRTAACIVLAIILLSPAVVNADEPETSAQRFVEQMSRGEYDKAVAAFDATMQQAMPAAKLETTWKGVLQSAGAFKRLTSSRLDKAAMYDIVHVTCEFEKAMLDVRVVFDRRQRIAGLFFVPARPKAEYHPPDYADPSVFREQDVTIGREPWALPGTLSLPMGAGPFPAVVLVHGSGPNDRDETVGVSKPFKDLAWGLASRGVTVLRYDKRTKVHAERMAELTSLTVREEVIDDVFAAVDLLRRQQHIDERRIFVVGHSLGGYLVPRMADDERGEAIAGFVILAGNTRPLEVLICEQTEYLLRLDGSLSESDQTQIEALQQLASRANDPALTDSDGAESLFGAPVAYWLDLRGYRPEQLAAAQIRQPTLILQGERDYQVTLEDFEGWRSTLSSRENFTLKSYPRLNHLFVEGDGPSTPAEYEAAGNVSKEVLDDLSQWIDSRSRRQR